jgi:ABC-type multidrug transport system fused ATPase/permease subunit
VLQETFLFSATIAENIAYGRPDATEEEIRAAAAIAQAAEFIDKLPKGYKTRVGERGVGLSGGQKQRVALARALLMDPRILILDEATASVDTETEYLIQEGLEDVMRDRTTLIIAKRLSTILSADKVIVLQGGTIAEFGTHAELLAQGGLYKRIFDGQFARASDVAAALDSVAAQVAGETAASISTSEEVR